MVVLAITSAGMTQAQSGGHLAGVATGQDGRGVSGVTVRYSRIPRFQRESSGRIVRAVGETEFSGMVNSASDGSFRIGPIPDGEYRVCAGSVSSVFLDNCKWTLGQVVRVSAGQVTSAGMFQLTPSATLEVHIDDPQAVLVPVGGQRPPNVVLGVRTERGGFIPFDKVSRDTSGLVATAAVPFARSLRLWVFSRSVRLSNELGVEIDVGSGSNLPFEMSQTENRREIRLKVLSTVRP
jgi:hypothetical protein